jgi:hypothetical protein
MAAMDMVLLIALPSCAVEGFENGTVMQASLSNNK